MSTHLVAPGLHQLTGPEFMVARNAGSGVWTGLLGNAGIVVLSQDLIPRCCAANIAPK
jgi:hypothetical protein